MDSIDQVLSESGKIHGDFSDHAELTQALKDLVHDSTNWDFLTAYQKEGIEMILHKIARALSGDPNHADHWRDMAGYAKLVCDRVEKVEACETQSTEEPRLDRLKAILIGQLIAKAPEDSILHRKSLIDRWVKPEQTAQHPWYMATEYQLPDSLNLLATEVEQSRSGRNRIYKATTSKTYKEGLRLMILGAGMTFDLAGASKKLTDVDPVENGVFDSESFSTFTFCDQHGNPRYVTIDFGETNLLDLIKCNHPSWLSILQNRVKSVHCAVKMAKLALEDVHDN